MTKDRKTMFHPSERLTLKTYSHLADKKRIPTDYELCSSNMLYYLAKGGFEVSTPIAAWYSQYQKNSLIKPEGLDAFVDPLQTTYTSYIKRQKDKEIVLDASSRQIDLSGYDKQMPQEWMEQLAQFMAPLRYVWHGFQMISAYLGSMAPEGKIAIVFAFQTMDEMRRIQRIAYRMRQIQETYPAWGDNSKKEWQEAAAWQPLRKGVEYLLVTYDWLEGFVALNLCFKPILDRLILIHYKERAQRYGDYQLGVLFHSFWEDCLWQQVWSRHLLQLLLKQDAKNAEIIKEWLTRWQDHLMPAVLALEVFFGDEFNACSEAVWDHYSTQLKDMNLNV